MSETPMNVAVCVSWKTDVMPVPSFFYYHKGCYDLGTARLSNQSVREFPARDISVSACCAWCRKKIREDRA
ncbi:MAG TPA: hypothetical protein VKR06_46525 [Ktedonosporobacter sp.]|nr:hypothetical protein [Ktedonosporobacter sp.]